MQDKGSIPVVSAAPQRGSAPALRIHLGNEGHHDVVYTLTPNDYEGRHQTVTIRSGGSWAVAWPTDADVYYDVIITANSAGGFKRRYAGRIA
ncbi:MAG TPA: phospholipase domain-containing protein [Streptosporangiaceae bacterium]|nr:phospholipase domain-containing protein [Streptosporangiaceae bacterium]